MNWGYKIVIVYLAFVAGIAVMVYKSATQKIDLVTADYYSKELQYQERIDAIERTGALSSGIQYQVKDDKITVLLPDEFTGKEVSGNAMLYCPSDNNRDVKMDFTVSDRTITIAFPSVAKGYYQLQLSWVAEGHTYYFEEHLFL